MKTIFSILLFLGLLPATGQDLPTPTANIQTLPSGSYVIAMDHTNQLNNGNDFNIKAYGLIVYLLNNSVKIKWVITSGKAKDGVDFTVNATKFKPVSGSASSLSFKAGPFVVFQTDTTGVAAKIDAFNSAISNSNDKIKVYRTNASVSVDIRYDMTGFVPKAALLDDGGNENIHEDYMTACNIPTANYLVTAGTTLLTDCYTFASEAHNNQSGSNQNNAIVAVKRFVEYGGNFLAQCEAITTYENNSLGHFQTTSGITDANSSAATSITYPYPDLSYSQFEGNYDISIGGSLRNWRINASGINSFHKQSKASADTTIIGTSVSKLHSGIGGLVFYLGNHKFDDFDDVEEINGVRMYMNAFVTPVTIAQTCAIGDAYMYPLSAKLLDFSGSLEHDNVSLGWEVSENELQKQFDIERSEDGQHYSIAASVSSNNLPGKIKYNASQKMNASRHYYRLKITSKQSIVSYSRVLVFQTTEDDSQGMRILNQPVTDRLEFSFNTSRGGPVEIKIVDLLGRTQFTKTMNVNAGNNKIQLTLPYAWANGIYVAEVKAGTERSIAKFIKQ